jgi:hypothetical protein
VRAYVRVCVCLCRHFAAGVSTEFASWRRVCERAYKCVSRYKGLTADSFEREMSNKCSRVGEDYKLSLSLFFFLLHVLLLSVEKEKNLKNDEEI